MTITLSGSLGETFPNWTTATRPATPNAGQTGFNTTTGQMETYNGSAWTVYTAATTQGTSGQYLQSAGAGAAPTWATPATAPSGGATASGSVTLTSSSAAGQYITSTAFNQTVTLPDATTMTKNPTVFTIQNAGQYPLKLLDNAGNKLGFIYPGITALIGLTTAVNRLR